jgi:hypothetical protein
VFCVNTTLKPPAPFYRLGLTAPSAARQDPSCRLPAGPWAEVALRIPLRADPLPAPDPRGLQEGRQQRPGESGTQLFLERILF